jgi:non-ribosomal peptide synthetase component E (peptide arylation enzyme)
MQAPLWYSRLNPKAAFFRSIEVVRVGGIRLAAAARKVDIRAV